MPPSDARSHDGIQWPTLCVDDSDGVPAHYFTIGDWGGLIGHTGPKTFDNTRGKRKFVDGVDNRAQWLVAKAMKHVAKTSRPKLTLNVGDNFYPGGIESTCGQTDLCSLVNTGQWQVLFEQMYDDPHMNMAPWHGVLGNHDFGGFQFNKGWDQMLAYTWHSDRWIMPALYWARRVQHCHFAVDMFFIDSNVWDAHKPKLNPSHNICGAARNVGATCAAVRGPADALDCSEWFKTLWHSQLEWLERRLNRSDADWQIVVTHFPPQWDSDTWKRLSKTYGIDLILTGHRHQQEVHYRDGVLDIGGTAWAITGGGGGCTSESNPLRETALVQQYGFMDITVSNQNLTIDMWSWQQTKRSSTSIMPVPRGGSLQDNCYRVNATSLLGATSGMTIADGVELAAANLSHVGLEEVACWRRATCEVIGCGDGAPDNARCQCNKRCVLSGNCCSDYKKVCLARHAAKTIADFLPFGRKQRKTTEGELPEEEPFAQRRLSKCEATRRRNRGGPADGGSENPWERDTLGVDIANASGDALAIVGLAPGLDQDGAGILAPYIDDAALSMQADLASEPCLAQCGGRSGFCTSFCGVGRGCCRNGDVDSAPECARALVFLTDHHECVGLLEDQRIRGMEANRFDAPPQVWPFSDTDDRSATVPMGDSDTALARMSSWTLAAGIALCVMGVILLAPGARRLRKRERQQEYAHVSSDGDA